MDHNENLRDYHVEITEVLSRIVTVEATSLREAKEIVETMYQNEEIVLDSSDFISNKIKGIINTKDVSKRR